MAKPQKRLAKKYPKWYLERRKTIEEAFELGYPKNDLTRTFDSPCGKYYLESTPYHLSDRMWDYSENRIYREDHELVYKILRNYATCPNIWITGHPNGDFLLTGEDRHALTVVDLQQRYHVTHVTPDIRTGESFVLDLGVVSDDMTKVCLVGSTAFQPIEYRFCEIKNPMKLPYKPLCSIHHFKVKTNTKIKDWAGRDYTFDEPSQIVEWDDDSNTVTIIAETLITADDKMPIEAIRDEKKLDRLYENASLVRVRANHYRLSLTDGKYEHIKTDIEPAT